MLSRAVQLTQVTLLYYLHYSHQRTDLLATSLLPPFCTYFYLSVWIEAPADQRTRCCAIMRYANLLLTLTVTPVIRSPASPQSKARDFPSSV